MSFGLGFSDTQNDLGWASDVLNGAIIKGKRRVGKKTPSGMEKQHVNKERMNPEGNYLYLLVSVFSKILLKCPTVSFCWGEPNCGGILAPLPDRKWIGLCVLECLKS